MKNDKLQYHAGGLRRFSHNKQILLFLVIQDVAQGRRELCGIGSTSYDRYVKLGFWINKISTIENLNII